jgi:Skp family chaperone for outer membrane proteins
VGWNHPQIFELLATGGVALVKTLEYDRNFVAQIKAASPRTLVVARYTPLPTPDLDNWNPLEAARQFVELLLPIATEPSRLAHIDAWEAYNEPTIVTADQMARLAEFEAEQDDFQAQQEKLRKELEAARDAAEDRAISEREREKRMDVLKEKLLALRQLEQRVRETRLARQRELNEQEGRMLKRILVKVQAIIDRVAAEKGYALVLDSGARNPGGVPTVIFAQPTLDITEQVVGLVKAEAKTADTDARAEPVEAVAPTVKGE